MEENIVEKGENAGYQHFFPPFATCFICLFGHGIVWLVYMFVSAVFWEVVIAEGCISGI